MPTHPDPLWRNLNLKDDGTPKKQTDGVTRKNSVIAKGQDPRKDEHGVWLYTFNYRSPDGTVDQDFEYKYSDKPSINVDDKALFKCLNSYANKFVKPRSEERDKTASLQKAVARAQAHQKAATECLEEAAQGAADLQIMNGGTGQRPPVPELTEKTTCAICLTACNDDELNHYQCPAQKCDNKICVKCTRDFIKDDKCYICRAKPLFPPVANESLASDADDQICVVCETPGWRDNNQLVPCFVCAKLMHQNCCKPRIPNAIFNENAKIALCSDCIRRPSFNPKQCFQMKPDPLLQGDAAPVEVMPESSRRSSRLRSNTSQPSRDISTNDGKRTRSNATDASSKKQKTASKQKPKQSSSRSPSSPKQPERKSLNPDKIPLEHRNRLREADPLYHNKHKGAWVRQWWDQAHGGTLYRRTRSKSRGQTLLEWKKFEGVSKKQAKKLYTAN